jgi:hypothetical protein
MAVPLPAALNPLTRNPQVLNRPAPSEGEAWP